MFHVFVLYLANKRIIIFDEEKTGIEQGKDIILSILWYRQLPSFDEMLELIQSWSEIGIKGK